MKLSCSKCTEWIDRANIVAEGGELYSFCDDCYEVAKDLPTNFLAVFTRKTSGYVKGKIERAKKKREEGNSPWDKTEDNKD